MEKITEIWKAIPGWEGLYEASSEGKIRSLDRLTNGAANSRRLVKGKVLKPGVGTWGYQNVALKRTGEKAITKAVHRLVCETFHGTPAAKMDAAHADGSRTNNRSGNLRWASRSDNHADKWSHGTMSYGVDHHNAKLTPDQVRAIRKLSADGQKSGAIAKLFGIERSNVSYIVHRKTWVHV